MEIDLKSPNDYFQMEQNIQESGKTRNEMVMAFKFG